MRYQLYIVGMNGPAWVKLSRQMIAGPTQHSNGANVIVAGDGSMQPVITGADGALQLLTREGPLDCVEKVGGAYVVCTKPLPSGDLQYVRRIGDVGIAPASDYYGDGDTPPLPGQWREHPSDVMVKTSMTRGPRPKRPALPELPDGAQLA